MIREFNRELTREFSAVKTAWRRGRHSTLRYRSLSRKARRVGGCGGPTGQSILLDCALSAQSCRRVRFGHESSGEPLAILWLKAVPFYDFLGGQIGLSDWALSGRSRDELSPAEEESTWLIFRAGDFLPIYGRIHTFRIADQLSRIVTPTLRCCTVYNCADPWL